LPEGSTPNESMMQRAELKIKEKQFSDLQDEVIDYVRRNSLLKDAKNL
jgi:hypothetical protein